MLGIGDFSRASGLPVKTLRFYHDQGLLAPSRVDERTGYRYYGVGKLEVARVITRLRALDFPLADIATILRDCEDDSDILDYLQRQKAGVHERIERYREIHASLDEIINREREARTAMERASYEIEEKTLAPVLVAGVRMKGHYSDCGKGFARIGKRYGRHIAGKPLLLIYDSEYREGDADFEACMPIRKGQDSDGVSVRELPGGDAVTLLHRGPYEELSRTYGKLFAYIGEQGYQTQVPSREVYLKGPGIILKGNPKNYLTEVQVLVGRAQAEGAGPDE